MSDSGEGFAGLPDSLQGFAGQRPEAAPRSALEDLDAALLAMRMGAPTRAHLDSLAARVRQEQQAMQIEMGRRIADRAKAEAALAATTQENESLKAQWSVMARACGNYRDFGGPVSAEVLAKRQLITDADYKAAAQAIVQLSALTSALEPLKAELDKFDNVPALSVEEDKSRIFNTFAAVRALLTAAER